MEVARKKRLTHLTAVVKNEMSERNCFVATTLLLLNLLTGTACVFVLFRTEILSVDGENEQPILPPAAKELNGCTQTLSKALGVSLCIKGSVPKPFYNNYGFNMPFNMGITLQKNDLAMEGYELKLKYPTAQSVSTKFHVLSLSWLGYQH